ncbi:MAG: hypothetical protein ACOYMR_04835, partial [Ilumatobacteraceae bacterium]
PDVYRERRMRRALTLGLAAVLLALVGVVIVLSNRGSSDSSITVVRGVIGSEKKPFFDDPRVQAAFRTAGYEVQVDTAGSRQIATTVDLSKYDFAFPAGTPQAQKIKVDNKAATVYVPFSTPMAIASFEPIAKILATAGVAKDEGGWWSFDMTKFLALVADDTRWSDLAGSDSYPSSKQVLITSTDITTSNSAAMYASIASYVANANNVVASAAQAQSVAATIAPLFSRQGYTEQSSEAPFDDYLSIGAGKTPIVMIYESQFVARAVANDGSIQPGMVLMYPTPTIVSKHSLVPLTDAGDAIGRLLTNDPTLQDLAVQFGFRTADPAAFATVVKAAGIATAPNLIDVVEPPTIDNLEALINGIAAAMASSSANTTTATT